MNTSVSMIGVKAGSDVIGRDKIINYTPRLSQLDCLSNLFKTELSNKETTSKIIDELNHYSNAKSDIRTLKVKLNEAGFSYMVDEAEELKENISKFIVKNQHYKSAQKIITFILSDIESTFKSKIKPHLYQCQNEDHLQLLINDMLFSVIQDKLGENVLEIYNRQISGMVYFLTGNCHLEWK